MDATDVPLAPPGCPWAGWAPPNLNWCEEHLSGWIITPANTWSNLAYLVAAVLIWRAARRGLTGELTWLAPAMALMGAGSFLYHASCTFAFQVADFVGMYLVLWLFIVLNRRRAGPLTVPARTIWYAGGVLGSTAAMLAMAHLKLPYQSLILVLAGVIGFQESRLASSAPAADYRELRRAWALLAVALACSVADLTRVWCDPGNHWLQGHAAWHVLSAAGLYRAFRFYAALELIP